MKLYIKRLIAMFSEPDVALDMQVPVLVPQY